MRSNLTEANITGRCYLSPRSQGNALYIPTRRLVSIPVGYLVWNADGVGEKNWKCSSSCKARPWRPFRCRGRARSLSEGRPGLFRGQRSLGYACILQRMIEAEYKTVD